MRYSELYPPLYFFVISASYLQLKGYILLSWVRLLYNNKYNTNTNTTNNNKARTSSIYQRSARCTKKKKKNITFSLTHKVFGIIIANVSALFSHFLHFLKYKTETFYGNFRSHCNGLREDDSFSMEGSNSRKHVCISSIL